MNFLKLRTPFLTEYLRWLLLKRLFFWNLLIRTFLELLELEVISVSTGFTLRIISPCYITILFNYSLKGTFWKSFCFKFTKTKKYKAKQLYQHLKWFVCSSFEVFNPDFPFYHHQLLYQRLLVQCQQCEICSKLTIKTQERRHWLYSGTSFLTLNTFHPSFWCFYC